MAARNVPQVKQGPDEVVRGRSGERRPGQGDRRPDGDQPQAGERDTPGPACGQQLGGADRGDEHEAPGDERGDQPRTVEVAPGVEGEHGGAHEQGRGRDG